MKTTDIIIRFSSILALLSCCTMAILGDIPLPISPGQPNAMPGYELGSIISPSLFALAGALVLVWIGRKFSKRSSK